MSNNPIGIFDSGIGGTSIFKEIHALLPNENCIYLADSVNAPYGNKSKEEIVELSVKNTEFLINKGSKIIVVACNTATTNAIDFLRENYNIPFIGIEPAIKPAALNTKTKAIGILATKGTLSSQLFHKTTDLYASGIKVIEQVGEGIVPLIESGKVDSGQMQLLLERYLKPMLEQNIDFLVLGCTHYPYLIPMLSKMLPSEVEIIDSGLAVAKQTQSVLASNDLLNSSVSKPRIKLFSNGDVSVLDTILNSKFDVSYLNF
ncbi:glutamate racemase [uncultured Winogradskyella sp.]|uniref:glutamate racemase n=1 Tax=uncultured Winogradskyella sp. TaxID=395353 RepID=UPI002621CC58|nr:glutamate racemase [uncultured Winogradskyella sp.]|tara:strand:+ start:3249 stop:4028 length:780 start_codon:yes stop_codon:yes gene_type:complete